MRQIVNKTLSGLTVSPLAPLGEQAHANNSLPFPFLLPLNRGRSAYFFLPGDRRTLSE